MSGIDATSWNACPHCCYLPTEGDGLLTADFDDDLDDVATILSRSPLSALCDNCTQPYARFRGFRFRMPGHVDVVYHPDARTHGLGAWASGLLVGRSLRSGLGRSRPAMETFNDIKTAQRSVRRRIADSANRVIVSYQEARRAGRVDQWLEQVAPGLARIDLSSAVFSAETGIMVAASRGPGSDHPLSEQVSGLVAQILLYRTLIASATDDPLVALDAALRPSLLTGKATDLLLSLATREGAGLAAQFQALLVLAWAADRTSTHMLQLALTNWSRVAAAAVAAAPPAGVDPDFYARTVDPAEVIELLSIAEGKQLRTLALAVVDHGLVDPAMLIGRLSVTSTALVAADFVARSTREPTDSLPQLIYVMIRQGWLAEAAAVVERRRDDLGNEGGMETVRDLVEAFNVKMQPSRGLEVGDGYLDGRQTVPSALAGAPIVSLWNEMGNACRLLRQFDRALELYGAAAEELPRSERRATQTPILLRNMAIVLRDMGAPAAARSTLYEVLELEQDPRYRARCWHSITLCEAMLGAFERASFAAERGLAELTGVAAVHRMDRLNLLISAAQCAELLGDKESAAGHAEEARSLAVSEHALNALAAATTVLAGIAVRGGSTDASDRVADALQTITNAESATDSARDLTNLGGMRVGLASATGNVEELKRLSILPETDRWETFANLADSHLQAGDVDEAQRSVGRAWAELLGQIAADELASVDITVLRNAEGLQTTTADASVLRYRRGRRDPSEVVFAIESASSLTGGLAAWASDQRGDAALQLRGGGLLDDLPADVVIVAGLQCSWGTELVVRRGDEVVLPLCMEFDELAHVRGAVAAVTSRCGPAGDPLPTSTVWTTWSQRLSAALTPHVKEADTVVFVSGASFGGLPLHMVDLRGRPLCLTVPFAYVSSILQLAAVRSRPTITPQRGRAVGIVSVPKGNDTDAATAAFARGAAEFARVIEDHGLPLLPTLNGRAATREAAIAMFEEAYLVFLSCHGIGKPGEGTHALQLAAKNQLPPGGVRSRRQRTRRPFDFSWDDIVSPTPSIVISGACSSSSASFSRGGERVSLDRCFLAADTKFFFGPMWDVSLDMAQTVAISLVAKLLAGAPTWSHAWLATLTDLSDTIAPAAWQAFVPTGDWRHPLV